MPNRIRPETNPSDQIQALIQDSYLLGQVTGAGIAHPAHKLRPAESFGSFDSQEDWLQATIARMTTVMAALATIRGLNVRDLAHADLMPLSLNPPDYPPRSLYLLNAPQSEPDTATTEVVINPKLTPKNVTCALGNICTHIPNLTGFGPGGKPTNIELTSQEEVSRIEAVMHPSSIWHDRLPAPSSNLPWSELYCAIVDDKNSLPSEHTDWASSAFEAGQQATRLYFINHTPIALATPIADPA